MLLINAVSFGPVSKVIDSILRLGRDVIDRTTPNRYGEITDFKDGAAVVESVVVVEWEDARELTAKFISEGWLKAWHGSTGRIIFVGRVERWFLSCALRTSFIFHSWIVEAELLSHPW